MDGILLAHLLNGLLMIAIPVGLAIFLVRQFGSGWRLWLVGALVFVLSQVGHIPFNAVVSPFLKQPAITSLPVAWQTIIMAVFLGLSAGVFEEFFRYGMFRWLAKDARSWRKGVVAGAGHGGMEAIILGALAVVGLLQLSALRDVDLTALFPANQLPLAQQQVSGYWSMPWYYALFGALERLLTIPIQISLAVLVLQAFTRRQFRWVVLAIGYHALLDATAVLAVTYVGVYATEALVGVFTVASLIMIFTLRQPEPPMAAPAPASPLPAFTLKPVDETAQKLIDTRYQ